jgi:tetratricopeptide (TPR) repeat protein
MARRRKRNPDGEQPERHPERPPRSPDRRAMEGGMSELVRSLQTESGMDVPDTPLYQAQALIYQAFEEEDGQCRVELAREALALCPDCADAYVLLAENAPSRKQALELYQQGVAAGERALGAAGFQDYAGHFWGVLDTRPYMRARIGLALELWTAARRDEAVRHLQDMLRLNPSDNQGVRYTLAGFLLFLDRDEELAQLLEQNEEGSAFFAYTRALLFFRQQGDTPAARTALQMAMKTNQYLPDYLLGLKFPPGHEPDGYSFGEESEALVYIGSFLVGWKSTPGAIAWLRAVVGAGKQTDPPHARGPLSFIKKWLENHLPREEDVWMADFRQLPNWIRIGGQPVRPWNILVTSWTDTLVLAHQITEEEPSAALLWDTLVQAMQYPAAGEPHRPSELQVRAGERWASLEPHLAQIGVTLTPSDELEPIDLLFQDMVENVCGKPHPGLLDMPGVTPQQVGSFYEAAAEFFRRAPWKQVGYESAIRVECDRFESGPWYAVLMGLSGLTMGLALYEKLKSLRRMWARDDSDATARQAVATTVTFGEEWDVPIADLEAARKHGWQVARADAWPEIFHKERGLSMRPPLAWELELIEGCLRTVPEFVNMHRQDDPTREEITVRGVSGEWKVTLSWVGDDEKR